MRSSASTGVTPPKVPSRRQPKQVIDERRHRRPTSEDPGWRLSWSALIVLIPYLARSYIRRAGGDPLVNLRSVYMTFLGSLVTLGVVLPFILPFAVEGAAVYWALGIGAMAGVIFVVERLFERPLSCDSVDKLAAGFHARMFLRVAFGETTALWGFVAAFLATSSWVYFFSVLCSLPALLRAAPTRAALIREQDELRARGCNQSLIAALRTSPPKPK
jgi:hypothetical protein